MNKTDRLSFLRSRHAALFGVAISGLLSVSKAEIRETAQETVSAIALQNDDSTQDAEEQGFTSSLPFDSTPKVRDESEENLLLTNKEKRKLVADMDLYHAQKIRPFALAICA